MVKGYFILVVLYYLFGVLVLPDSVCATGPYILGGFLFPVVVFALLYFLSVKFPNLFPPPADPPPPKKSDSFASRERLLSKYDASKMTTDEIWSAINSAHDTVFTSADSVRGPAAPPSPDPAFSSIDHMDGPSFERWCAALLRSLGYSDVELTKGSGDQGVDILASKDGIRYAIQCKCYSSDLGNHPVQEVHAGKYYYQCHIGVVMTNRHFTAGAKELAKTTGILLWDRDTLKSMFDRSTSDCK